VGDDEDRHVEGGFSPHGATPLSNTRLPITAAPTWARDARKTSVWGPVRSWRSPQSPRPAIHSWSRSPSSPSGLSGPSFGPVENPSSDIDMSAITFPMTSPSKKRPVDDDGEVSISGPRGYLLGSW
jgi:hypothetical protein